MNAAGAFGLLLVLVWLVRARPKEATAQPQGLDRRDAWIFLGIALLVAAAYARVARSYFLTDDFVLLLHADDFRRGILWTFTHGGGDGFFRPFFYLTFGAVEQIAHRNPLAWHAIELAIHTANCWMVYLLAGALGWSRFSACAAAALFAIHGTRPEAVVGINAQPDLLAALFTLITLVLFLRNRRWLALAAMILGLLSKEPAYSTPLLLTIIAFPRFKQTIPYWLAAVTIFLVRWRLMGGLGGYINPDGTREFLGLFGIVKGLGLRLWAVLFVPVNWSIHPGWIFLLLFAAYAAVLLISAPMVFPRRRIGIPAALLLAAALPAFSRLAIGSDLAKAHNVYLPSAGFCLLLGTILDRRWAASAIVMVFSVAALEHNLNAWKTASEKAASACQAGAQAVRSSSGSVAVVGLPHILNGVFFFHNGFPECVALRTGADPARVLLRDRMSGDLRGSTVLFWNPATLTLAPINR